MRHDRTDWGQIIRGRDHFMNIDCLQFTWLLLLHVPYVSPPRWWLVPGALLVLLFLMGFTMTFRLTVTPAGVTLERFLLGLRYHSCRWSLDLWVSDGEDDAAVEFSAAVGRPPEGLVGHRNDREPLHECLRAAIGRARTPPPSHR